ncbi:MAG: hypothetical protein RLZZ360_234 [Candidatus Parcubacteria bacterium]|jgi:putative transposase
MSTRLITLAPHEHFHVYNRGVDKRKIFLDGSDYRRFIELLYVANTTTSIDIRSLRERHTSLFDFDRGDTLVSIGAYCLMPNHFHILITSSVEGGITGFMSKISTGYSMYFNKRYDRSGALFQGRFKSQHADSDEYLKYLYAYIHLNPVKLIDKDWKERGSKDAAKSFDFAASFQYSSLQDYLGSTRPESLILDKQPFPEYFATSADTKNELFDWLTYQDFTINQNEGRPFAKGRPS